MNYKFLIVFVLGLFTSSNTFASIVSFDRSSGRTSLHNTRDSIDSKTEIRLNRSSEDHFVLVAAGKPSNYRLQKHRITISERANPVLKQPSIDPGEANIRQVENGLFHVTKFIGDKTWTIDERMKHYGVPGMSLAVVKDNRVIWSKGYGVNDQKSGESVTTKTLFPCGSISNSVSSAAVQNMVDKGMLDLNADINPNLRSSLPENELIRNKKVTLQNLLNDTDGGFRVIQQLMIDAAQQPYPAVMVEVVPGQSTNPELAPTALWSSAEELARFILEIQRAYHGKSTKVLSQDMARTMLDTELGVLTRDNGGEIYFGHKGGIEGFANEACVNRDNGCGVVVLTNGSHPEFVSEVVNSVARAYKWKNHAANVFAPMELSAKQNALIEGNYLRDGTSVQIYHQNGMLFLKKPDSSPMRMFRVGSNKFACRENEQLACFSFNKQSGQQQLVFQFPWEREAALNNPIYKMAAFNTLNEQRSVSGSDSSPNQYLAIQRVPRINTRPVQLPLAYQFFGIQQLDLVIGIIRNNSIMPATGFNAIEGFGEASSIQDAAQSGAVSDQMSLFPVPPTQDETRVLKNSSPNKK